MLKRLLATTTVLSASALSTLAANAAAVGPYVAGQLGYANTHMASKTSVLTNYDARQVFSGISWIRIGSSNNDKRNDGVAGRLAVGYQFSPYFASELGILGTRTERILGVAHSAGDRPAQFKLDQNVIDLVAKGILPVANRFNVYAKAGAAYITTNAQVDIRGDQPGTTRHYIGTIDLNSVIGAAKRKWAPEAAVGISYDLAPNVPVDLSWTHIHPFGKNSPGNIDFISFGLGYNFG